MGKRTRLEKQSKRHAFRRKAVDMFGGQCSFCGYNKNIDALIFHHVIPANKTDSISRIIADDYSWTIVLEELSKCVLACHNCHGEIHANSIPERLVYDVWKRIDPQEFVTPVVEKQTVFVCNVCNVNQVYPTNKNQRCTDCYRATSYKIQWPDIEWLKTEAESIGFSALGRQLGVSDNAIRKHINRYKQNKNGRGAEI